MFKRKLFILFLPLLVGCGFGDALTDKIYPPPKMNKIEITDVYEKGDEFVCEYTMYMNKAVNMIEVTYQFKHKGEWVDSGLYQVNRFNESDKELNWYDTKNNRVAGEILLVNELVEIRATIRMTSESKKQALYEYVFNLPKLFRYAKTQ